MKTLYSLLVLSSLLLASCNNVPVQVRGVDDSLGGNEELGMECETDTSTDDSQTDQAWKAALTKLYPELQVWGVVSICTLEGGDYEADTMVTFSVFNDEENNQRVVIVSGEGEKEVLEEASFNCNTMGDLGVSEVNGLLGDGVDLSCTSGDAGWMRIENFTLDLDSFTV